MKKQTDWVKLVKDAKKSNEGLKRLYAEMKPTFDFLENTCSRFVRDDALQLAKVNVWKALVRVDISRTKEIRAYLSKIALMAVYDSLRLYNKQHFYQGVGASVYYNIPRDEGASFLFDYGSFLGMYLSYVREHGSFHGAHTYIAKKLGVGKEKVRGFFVESSREFKKKYELVGSLN